MAQLVQRVSQLLEEECKEKDEVKAAKVAKEKDGVKED